MDRILRPDKLELNPSTSVDGTNSNTFTHWLATFSNFLATLSSTVTTDQAMYSVLINYVSPDIYLHISSVTTYVAAVNLLKTLFVKVKNENFARHCLSYRTQKDGESVEQYILALEKLAKDCVFKKVEASEHQDLCVRTAFIGGLKNPAIRQRLLEETKSLRDTVASALTLEQANVNSEQYQRGNSVFPSTVNAAFESVSFNEPSQAVVAATSTNLGKQFKKACDSCGYLQHYKQGCPARDAICTSCKKKGHWAKVCRSKPATARNINAIPNVTSTSTPTGGSHLAAISSDLPHGQQSTHGYRSYLAATTAGYPATLSNAIINSKVNNLFNANILIDTGSSESFISKLFFDQLGTDLVPHRSAITMASESMVCNTLGRCNVDINLPCYTLENVRLLVLDGLCCDIILGHDVLGKHQKLVMNFPGDKPPIELQAVMCCALPLAKIDPPPLFANLANNIHPIACSSRKYSEPEKAITKQSIDDLLSNGTIRVSNSPWRAQVLITGLDKPHIKPRMVIDYSRTINRFTLLDAYPLPNMDGIAKQIAQYSIYSTYDLKSAYHQIPIREVEKAYTAFEAAGNLYEFNVIPFGVMNGVAAFQRVIDKIISGSDLQATFAYLDNITVCGDSQEEHDYNVDRFLSTVKKYGLTLNEDKTISSVNSINILGYLISKNTIRPDPSRMQPLLDLPLPGNPASLQRALGLFSYYARWVSRYSDRIQPLIGNPPFPLSEECRTAFEDVKHQIAGACIVCPNNTDTLVLETDASNAALSASLNQGGKPVAFFSRTLKAHERKHHAVEKEACAIIEACRKWQHYLVGRRFLLITDQQAVSFMFSHQNHGRVKNSKILRWRVELSTLDFEIKYRPGPENVTADCLSRAHCSAVPQLTVLGQLHIDLCHPGIVRLNHFVRSRNLPFSVEDVKRVTSQCEACAKLKPRYFKPENPPLIEATKPFDRISIDFKGPLPTSTRNKYLLTVIDEYSRFPFAFPCPNQESSTIVKCLTELFSIFGTAGYVHSDNGPSLISEELHDFFLSHGIAYSNSTKYNPQGNGQVERYNGVIWKGIELALFSKNWPTTHWEHVVPVVLHSQRSLLCTATNETPHERLFSFARRTASGPSLPSWLLQKGPVLVKRHVRRSKYEPLVDEVELVSCTPTHAKVKYPCGREDSVSLRHLAPLPAKPLSDTVQSDTNTLLPPAGPALNNNSAPVLGPTTLTSHPASTSPSSTAPAEVVSSVESPVRRPLEDTLRRSARVSKPPDRFEAG